jgi:hypothetical protein
MAWPSVALRQWPPQPLAEASISPLFDDPPDDTTERLTMSSPSNPDASLEPETRPPGDGS